MTLIRALPDLCEHVPSPPTSREQLQRLEMLARQELQALQRSADAAPAATPAGEWASLAWDLGLEGLATEAGPSATR